MLNIKLNYRAFRNVMMEKMMISIKNDEVRYDIFNDYCGYIMFIDNFKNSLLI